MVQAPAGPWCCWQCPRPPRQIHLRMQALVAREGASLPADVLAGVVAEAGTQLSEAELMHAGLALQLAVVALESQPEAALEAARSKVRGMRGGGRGPWGADRGDVRCPGRTHRV